MASEVRGDGRVIALNITKPAPSLDLHGFQWRGSAGLAIEEVEPVEDEVGEAPAMQLFSQTAEEPHRVKSQLVLDSNQVPPKQQVAPARVARVAAAPVAAKDDTFPLDVLEGTWAGNGFNSIFVPLSKSTAGKMNIKREDGPDDNILILNLTTEQWQFGPNLGKVPNRGLGEQDTIDLDALAYNQTVQDVTNPLTGKPDRVETNKTSIHFEPGVFLRVPASNFHLGEIARPSIVRMASIPHGTTINAQGLVPGPQDKTVRPNFDPLDTTPFSMGQPSRKVEGFFTSMIADKPNGLRVPSDLKLFNNKELPGEKGKFGSGRITTEIIKNPHLVLAKAVENQTILSTTTFELSTGVGGGRDQSISTAKLNGGGTTNISFLHGFQTPPPPKDDKNPGKVAPKVKPNPKTDKLHITTLPADKSGSPNGHAESVTNRWWIEKVQYDIVVPPLLEGETATLFPKMPTVPALGRGPAGEPLTQPSTAPTPKFAVTAPAGGLKKETNIKVEGMQLQYSQTVNLNFGPEDGPMLTWPHVSVATLVPVNPQPWQMK